MDKENKKCYTNKSESEYWKLKPVAKTEDYIYSSTKISNLNNTFYQNKNNITLPNNMFWNVTYMEDTDNINMICIFLNKFYKNENNIIFDEKLLKIILGNDGFVLSIINNNNAICGTIACCIKNTIICDINDKFAHVHLLCAHTIYRKKNIAQILIDELTRFLNVEKKISQGVFMSNNKICKPVSIIRQYYRPINYNKLHQSNFLTIDGNLDIINKKFIVKGDINENYVPFNIEHLNDIFDLYNKYMSRYNMVCCYNKKEFENIILNPLVKCYVILKDNKVIDFVSYCMINYLCTDNIIINAGHIFLYSLNNEYGENMMDNLVKIMGNNNIDIAITNDDMDINNMLLIENNDDKESDVESYDKIFEHKFLKQRKTYLNLFNWKAPFLNSKKISMFLI
jgi:hypothetical protein